MPDKDGNETPREKAKRERQERIDLVNRSERKRRSDRQEEAAWEDALEAGDVSADAYLNQQFQELTGLSQSAAQDALKRAQNQKPSDEDVIAAQKAILDAKNAAKGGLFSSKNPAKAKKILIKNKDKINKAIAKGKKKWWQ